MALAMVGGLFGIHGAGMFGCMDKVMGYGFAGRTGKANRRSAGAESFARRAHQHQPAGLTEEEALCAQVGGTVKLIIAGLHEEALRDMNEAERCQTLAQAGLDPEEFAYLAM